MAYDEDLADRVRAALGARKNLREQKMFGGIAFMIDDKMTVGVHGPNLMVRVSSEDHDAMVKEPGARIMDMIPRPMKGFLFVGPAGTKNAASLKKWIHRSTSHVATLPAKKKTKKR